MYKEFMLKRTLPLPLRVKFSSSGGKLRWLIEISPVDSKFALANSLAFSLKLAVQHLVLARLWRESKCKGIVFKVDQ